ncbi:MAG: hypothetical protein KC609_01090 [Myxococcales bacterium]|nr:hypothetical protein [Myxococcales bacterium]
MIEDSGQRRRVDRRLLIALFALGLAFVGEQVYHRFFYHSSAERPSRPPAVGGSIVLLVGTHPLIARLPRLLPRPPKGDGTPVALVELLRPADRTLTAPEFQFDALIVARTKPTRFVLVAEGRRLAQGVITPDQWEAPGRALLYSVAARLIATSDGWHTMVLRVYGDDGLIASSTPTRVFTVLGAPVTPLPREVQVDLRQALEHRLAPILVALDRARRIPGARWATAPTYRAALVTFLQTIPVEELRLALGAVFEAEELGQPVLALAALDLVNVLFDRLGLPFFVSADALRSASGRERFYVFSYALERPIVLRYQGRDVPALLARRIDKLNVRRALLGHKSTGIARAILLVRQIERLEGELATCIRSLRECRRIYTRRLSAGTMASARLEAVLTSIGAELRGLLPAGCEQRERCAELGSLLRLMVAHHEVRHVIDHRQGPPLARSLRRLLSARLQDVVVRDPADLSTRLRLGRMAYNTVAATNAELSAFLAELAEAQGGRRYTLFMLYLNLADPALGRSSYLWVARTILAKLGARALGTTDDWLLASLRDRRWERSLMRLIEIPPATIGLWAAELYRAEFGEYHPATRTISRVPDK